MTLVPSSILPWANSCRGDSGHQGRRRARMIGGIPPTATMYLQPLGTSVKAAPNAYEINWPSVTLILSKAIIRPRCLAGASSPM
jgi:hypothetical protein